MAFAYHYQEELFERRSGFGQVINFPLTPLTCARPARYHSQHPRPTTQVALSIAPPDPPSPARSLPRVPVRAFLEFTPANLSSNSAEAHTVHSPPSHSNQLQQQHHAQIPTASTLAPLSPDAVSLPASTLVYDAIDYVRRLRPLHDRIYIVHSANQRLLGHVLLSDLLFAGERCPDNVTSLLRPNPVIARPGKSIHQVAAELAAASETSAPLLNEKDILVGVVRAVDIAQHSTPDITNAPYFGTSANALFAARMPWLVTLLVLQTASTAIMDSFSDLLEHNVLLTFFITTIVGAAGNSGSQSAAMLIVGLARGEVDAKRDFWRVLGREFVVAVALGSVLSALTFLRVLLLEGGTIDFNALLSSSYTISLALLLTVVFASVTGSATPLIFKLMGIDPSLGAGPALTTLTDISGVMFLCFTAAMIMHSP